MKYNVKIKESCRPKQKKSHNRECWLYIASKIKEKQKKFRWYKRKCVLWIATHKRNNPQQTLGNCKNRKFLSFFALRNEGALTTAFCFRSRDSQYSQRLRHADGSRVQCHEYAHARVRSFNCHHEYVIKHKGPNKRKFSPKRKEIPTTASVGYRLR